LKADHIESLRKVRQLSSHEEVLVFDEMLGQLGKKSLSPEDIQALLCIFLDTTKHEEVMYGLLHLIESHDTRCVIRALIRASPQMIEGSDWLDIFIIRTMNSFDCREVLVRELDAAINSNGGREVIRRISLLKEDSFKRIRDSATYVLSEIDRTK
jgi:hypothetical protein